MKKIIVMLCLLLVLLLNNCATIMKGYSDTIRIENVPEDLQILDENRIDIPIYEKIVEVVMRDTANQKTYWTNKNVKEIKLRSKKEQVLIQIAQGKEKKIKLYGKIDIFYLILDTILGIYPAFIDGYTGNWYKFEDIKISE